LNLGVEGVNRGLRPKEIVFFERPQIQRGKFLLKRGRFERKGGDKSEGISEDFVSFDNSGFVHLWMCPNHEGDKDRMPKMRKSF
jgi:hypothetical protein